MEVESLNWVRIVFFALLAPLLGTGCAGISGGALDHKKPADPDENIKGIPYYERSAFLLVVPDAIGGYTTEIVYLPDSTKLRYIEPWQYLASSKVDLTFTNGSLDSAKADIAADAIPKALIDAATSAVKKTIAAGALVGDQSSKTNGRTLVTPYLFKFDMEDSRPKLVGSGGFIIELPTNVAVRGGSQKNSAPPPENTGAAAAPPEGEK